MGLIAFCGFVLPWGAVALWLVLTRGKPDHTGVPWRPLTDYVAPGDDPRPGVAAGDATPSAGPRPLSGEGSAEFHIG